MNDTTKSEGPKLHVRGPRSPWDEERNSKPPKAICDEPAAPDLLLTDIKFIALGANHRCTSCETIQNRAVQTVKLKKGEGPVRPKDLQSVYSQAQK